MCSRLVQALTLVVAFGLFGCKAMPWIPKAESKPAKSAKMETAKDKADPEKTESDRSSAVSESDNFAAKARPRTKQGPSSYFYNDQARQIEKNLGLRDPVSP